MINNCNHQALQRAHALLHGCQFRLATRVISQQVRDMVLDWDKCQAVSRSPDVMSGALVFKHSRLPVSALFENIKSGATIDQFLDWFPGPSRDQVEDVIRFVTESARSENLVRPRHS